MKKILIPIYSIFGSLIWAFNSVYAVPVNINQAEAAEIAEALKGIGQKKAEAIVEYRNRVGQFESVEQLTEVKGIGSKLLSTLKEEILLHSP